MKHFVYIFLILPIWCISQVQIGDDINGNFDFDESGFSVAISSNGDIVAIGAIGNDGSEMNGGHVRIYENVNGVWTRFGEDIEGGVVNGEAGYSVSLSSDGMIVAIGVIGSGAATGSAIVFEYQTDSWVRLGTDMNGESANDRFGYSVSLSSDGTKIAVSSIFNGGGGNQRAGHVRVFEFQTDSWVQLGQDIDGEAAQDLSGSSISLSADGIRVAIGATNNDDNGDNSGHVRVYEFQTDTWVQIGQDIDGEAATDRSGNSVSLSSDGNIVAIGASFNDGAVTDSGHVRVYEFQTNTWSQIGQDIDGEEASDESGYSVSLSADGSVVAIGAIRNNGNGLDSGHVRIYQNQTNSWVQVGNDIDGENSNDNASVTALSSDANVVAIGAFNNDANGPDSGHVRVFDLAALLSVDEVLNSQINIFPNPANNQFHIELLNSSKLDKVNIYNHLGQHVKSTTNLVIDISKYATGMYYVEINTSNGSVVKKLIKE